MGMSIIFIVGGSCCRPPASAGAGSACVALGSGTLVATKAVGSGAGNDALSHAAVGSFQEHGKRRALQALPIVDAHR